MIIRILVTLLFIMVHGFAVASPVDDATNAYNGLIGRFWRGSAVNGYLSYIVSNSQITTAGGSQSGEIPQQTANLWQFAEGWNAIYACWKVGCASDAQMRLKAEWAWVQATHTLTGIGTQNSAASFTGSISGTAMTVSAISSGSLGVNATVYIPGSSAIATITADNAGGGTGSYTVSPSQTLSSQSLTSTSYSIASWGTQDDVTWVAMGLIELYDATGDANALVWAKAAIDAANTLFYDTTTGGGLWYYYPTAQSNTSTGPGKTIDNANFGLAEIEYYQFQCPIEGGACPLATVYYTKGKAIADWANSNLIRTNQTLCAATNDSLYWRGIWSNAGTNTPDNGACSYPYIITQTSSVTSSSGNQAMAGLNARIYNISGITSYATFSINTAISILQYEVSGGFFLDDGDARGGGYAAWNYLNDVLPLLSGTVLASTESALKQTAASVASNARAADGGYGGDWNGPLMGAWVSASPVGFFNQDRLEISGNSAIWAIIGISGATR